MDKNFYGYGIVDKDNKPFWSEDCVCQDPEPLQEIVRNMNEYPHEYPEREPFRVVQLISTYDDVSDREIKGAITRDGLTYKEIEIACLNIGINLECPGCASLFYTGIGDSHDENCSGLYTRRTQSKVQRC